MFLSLNVIGKGNPSRQQQQHSHKEKQRRDGDMDFRHGGLDQLRFIADSQVLHKKNPH